MKSVEFAIHPPTIVIKKKEVSVSPSFREIANFEMNDVQKDTMKALVSDDNGVKKLRNAKVEITMDKVDKLNINKEKKPNTVDTILKKLNQSPLSTEIKSIESKEIPDQSIHQTKYKFKEKLQTAIAENEKNDLRNGPVLNDIISHLDADGISIDSNLAYSDYLTEPKFSSFLQTQSSLQMMKYTKPISVLMKIADPPDAKIQKEFAKMEKKRDGLEKKLFDKAKKQFKLITEITAKELQVNLQHELVPFFVVSKNDLKGIKDIVKANFESKKGKDDMRFIEINHEELDKKYPYVNFFKNSTNLIDQVNLNRYTYEKILNMFSNSPNMHDVYYDKLYQSRINGNSKSIEREFGSELKKKIKENLKTKEQNKFKTPIQEVEEIENNKKHRFQEKIISTSIFKDKKTNHLKADIINTNPTTPPIITKPPIINSNFDSKPNLRYNQPIATNTSPQSQDSDFDIDTCKALSSKFQNLNLNCTPGSENFEILKKQYMSSFIQISSQISTNIKNNLEIKDTNKNAVTSKVATMTASKNLDELKGGEDSFINVKFCKY